LQMTTSVSCANRCTFCWRGYKAPTATEWKWAIDDPELILEGSLVAQYKLLAGIKGFSKSNQDLYEESRKIKHVALSLTGEPIVYPRINELLDLFNKRGISTFMVTNAQYPEAIRNLAPVTQLYISLDAPEKQLLKEVDVPLFKDYWERLLESLDEMAKKQERTCIRLTCVKDMNMVQPDKYAELIKRADPDFIECKGYMFVGSSRQRLSMKNMPWHEEVLDFAKAVNSYLPDYEIVSEHTKSRAVMLAKKKFFFAPVGKEKPDKKEKVWHTWIDFKKWHKLVGSGELVESGKSLLEKQFTSMDYCLPIPKEFLYDPKKERPIVEKRRAIEKDL